VTLKNNLDYFVCQTPLRISLFGGGSDLPAFINHYGYGKVINLTIDKYVYTGAKIHGAIFEKKYRLNYFKTENIQNIKSIKNVIIKGVLKYFDFNNPLYVNTISDVPAGTGLGSSSSFAVGLCLLMNSILRKKYTSQILAKQASDVLIKLIKSQAGYQDQYAAAYGGFNEFTFKSNGSYKINNLERYSESFLSKLELNSVLIFTGKSRVADNILALQGLSMKSSIKRDLIIKMIQISDYFKKNLILRKDCYSLYLELLNESWIIKKNLGSYISNSKINIICDLLNKKYLASTKILGAGAGGFVLASFRDKEKKEFFLKNNTNKFKILMFKFNKFGSRLIDNN
jgi:D-glycero-alpha-D-manno-heptose-7-phosphate kinase